MEFIIEKASDRLFSEKREIKTIEDLKKLSKEFDNERLIVDFEERCRQPRPTITIYDDYME